MTKDEIFDYVMNSPENTNPAVLRSMLNSIEGGGGGGLPPYENEDIGKTLALTASGESTTETVVTIEEQTVFFRAKLGNVSIKIANKPLWQVGDVVHLTLNGTLYECVVEENLAHKVGIQVMTDVGHVSITFDEKKLYFGGASDMRFTVSATIDVQSHSAAPEWVKGGAPFIINISEEAPQNFVADKKPSEVTAAFNSGRAIYISLDGVVAPISGIRVDGGEVISIIVKDISVSTENVFLEQIVLFSDPITDKFSVELSTNTYPST